MGVGLGVGFGVGVRVRVRVGVRVRVRVRVSGQWSALTPKSNANPTPSEHTVRGSSSTELGRGNRTGVTSGLLRGGVIFRGPRVLAGVAGETPRLLELRGRVRVRVGFGLGCITTPSPGWQQFAQQVQRVDDPCRELL